MLNSFEIYEDLSGSFDEKTARVLTKTLTRLYDEIRQTVGRDDFNQLKDVVQQLAEAQKELTQAQKRTEQRVEELAEAQKELAEAQKRTEETLGRQVEATGLLRKEVGGLSHVVGYGIEDRLMPCLKDFARVQYEFRAASVKRCFVRYGDGSHDEVNLLIEGEKDGSRTFLVGECKAHPRPLHLKRFAALLTRLREHFQTTVKGFLVGYILTPEFSEARKLHFPDIDAFQTYEVEERARKG